MPTEKRYSFEIQLFLKKYARHSEKVANHYRKAEICIFMTFRRFYQNLTHDGYIAKTIFR